MSDVWKIAAVVAAAAMIGAVAAAFSARGAVTSVDTAQAVRLSAPVPEPRSESERDPEPEPRPAEPATRDPMPTRAEQVDDDGGEGRMTSLVASLDTVDSVAFAPLDGSWSASLRGDEEMPSASLIKLLVLATLLDSGADMSQATELSPDEMVGGSGDIDPGVYTLYQLAEHMIAASDNSAANELIRVLGFDAINDEAAAIGLSRTRIGRYMMDASPNPGGDANVTCADDVLMLMLHLARDRTAVAFLGEQEIYGGIDALEADLGVTVAHKTGTLEGWDHDAAIVYGDDPYVLVVMGGGGMGAIEDAARAVDAAWSGRA